MNISRVLKEKNIPLQDLADKMGVSYSTISKTVTGNPTASTIEKIAKAIGCSPAEFFEEPQVPDTLRCPKCGTPLNIEIKEGR